MTDTFRITTNTQLIDPKTGLPSREMFLFLRSLNAVADDISALVVVDAITNGLTSKAASSNAVFDAVATLQASLNALSAALTAFTDTTAPETYLTQNDAVDGYLALDGGEMTGPLVLPSYTVATVPAAAEFARGLIWVSNETGGATVAYYNGSTWKRVHDAANIS